MKTLSLLFSSFFVVAKAQDLPQIVINNINPRINPRSNDNGIPSIDITFPDGSQDHLVLERHYMCEADKMAKKMNCNFIGHLANEKEACVAVTGCPGERMEFTINSKHAGRGNRFILHQNGTMEKVESAFKVISSFLQPDNIANFKVLK